MTWHESEERISNKDIAGKKQELENLNTMLAKVLFRLLFLFMNFCDKKFYLRGSGLKGPTTSLPRPGYLFLSIELLS